MLGACRSQWIKNNTAPEGPALAPGGQRVFLRVLLTSPLLDSQQNHSSQNPNASKGPVPKTWLMLVELLGFGLSQTKHGCLLDVVAHTFSPRAQEADLLEFEACLVYTASSRTARHT